MTLCRPFTCASPNVQYDSLLVGSYPSLVAPVCDTPLWPHMWIYLVAPVCDTPLGPHMWIYLVAPVCDTPMWPHMCIYLVAPV